MFLTMQGRMPLPTSIDEASRMLDVVVKLLQQLLGESRSVIEPQDVVHPAKGGRDMLRFFKELKQSVVNDWGNARPPVEEEDKEFFEKKEKLWDLEQQLTNASKQYSELVAESLVKTQQDMGDTMGELGLVFIKLTKFENEQAAMNTQRVRAVDMKSVATAAVKASRLYWESNAETVKHFALDQIWSLWFCWIVILTISRQSAWSSKLVFMKDENMMFGRCWMLMEFCYLVGCQCLASGGTTELLHSPNYR